MSLKGFLDFGAIEIIFYIQTSPLIWNEDNRNSAIPKVMRKLDCRVKKI